MQNRLKEVRRNSPYGKSQQSFSDYLGIPMSNLASYESGRRAPSDAVISLICNKCNVSEKWLKTGEGEPFIQKSTNDQIEEWVNRVLADRDEAIRKKFIIALSNVSDEGWKEIDNFVKSLLKDD